jgi:hypothetical protein
MRFIAAALVAVAMLPDTATGQDTRASVLERQRADKATLLKPYEPRKLEKLVMAAEDGSLRRLISPHNGFFAEYGYEHRPTGAGIGLGGGFRHDLFHRRARVVLEAGGTLTRRYYMLRGDFSLPRLLDERLELGIEGVVRHHPQEDFYGLGSETLKDDRVSYLFDGDEVEGRAVLKPRAWLNVGSRFGYLTTSVGSGEDSRYPSIEERFDDSTAPGLVIQPDYVYGDAFATVDYRDEPGNARAGGYYTVTIRRYSDRDFDRYSFTSVNVLAQQFVPIFDKKRVFAFQTGIITTSASDGHEVPFFMRPTIGGGNTVRSLVDYRFRDSAALWLNAEYRWEAFGLLDMALFTDWGKVAPTASDLDFSDLKHAYGIGFRFNIPQAVFLRFDIGAGAGEGVRYIFKFSKVF